MWHASSVKGYVCKQSLEEITLNNQFLDYCTIMPMTDRPARAGLTVDAGNDNNDCTYSVYWDLSCDYFIGRISSGCSLEEQEYLDDFALYPNYDHTAYERKLILRKEVTPYTLTARKVRMMARRCFIFSSRSNLMTTRRAYLSIRYMVLTVYGITVAAR
jgi:hypothetical protein